MDVLRSYSFLLNLFGIFHFELCASEARPPRNTTTRPKLIIKCDAALLIHGSLLMRIYKYALSCLLHTTEHKLRRFWYAVVGEIILFFLIQCAPARVLLRLLVRDKESVGWASFSLARPEAPLPLAFARERWASIMHQIFSLTFKVKRPRAILWRPTSLQRNWIRMELPWNYHK